MGSAEHHHLKMNIVFNLKQILYVSVQILSPSVAGILVIKD